MPRPLPIACHASAAPHCLPCLGRSSWLSFFSLPLCSMHNSALASEANYNTTDKVASRW